MQIIRAKVLCYNLESRIDERGIAGIAFTAVETRQSVEVMNQGRRTKDLRWWRASDDRLSRNDQ